MGVNLSGIPSAPGLGMGHAVVLPKPDQHNPPGRISPEDAEREITRFEEATKTAVADLERIRDNLARKLGQTEAEILGAQLLMLVDPSLQESVRTKIRHGLMSAGSACLESVEEQARLLESLDDEYLAARAADVRDIGGRLLTVLAGTRQDRELLSRLNAGSVIVADDLAPSQTAALDVSKVAAIVLKCGGKTSHTAILARSLGIPAVTGVESAASAIRTGDFLLVDGNTGIVTVGPDETERSLFDQRFKAELGRKQRLTLLRDLPSITSDNRPVKLAANVGGPKDVERVKEAGAEGVGLFRTEFLFVDRSSLPSENEQYKAYSQLLGDLAPLPIVIRTLDAGGDKALPYLGLPKEDNPFLGLRAIRLCLKEKALFRIQLRALLRASIHGNLQIMFPMIASLAELRAAKHEYESVKTELVDEGFSVSPGIRVGIMIEVPSAAVQADILATECDFFSIGTNDLVQYTMACDRGNPSVSYLNDPFQPAVLRLIARTIQEGHRKGIPVGMCGEMAGLPAAIPLLVGMGIDEISMAPASVPTAKEIVRNLDSRNAAEIWNKAKSMTSPSEIRSYLEGLTQAQ